MTPILYEKDEIDFTSQGLGSLVEIYDVDVAEQRNGLLQLTASYPVTGVRYDDISVGRIILAKPNQRDEPHAFRITSTDLDIMGHNVMIEADSITYDLNHNIVKHLNVSGADGQTMMSALKNAIVNPSIFNFYSDINHVSGTSLDYVNPMEAVMGVKGSFLQIWGGELKRENRRIAMFNRRGRDNVATFRLGKNISGLKYKVDISSLVTRILPIKIVQENDTTTYLEGTPVNSQYINNYEQVYAIKVDFADDTIKTVDDLNNAAAKWFVESANTGRDKPSIAIDIDVLSLQDSADYQDKFKDLESVGLTDTVTVYVPEYGINVTAIVNELHFDPIQERVTKLTVGTAKQSFADSSRTQLSDLQDKIISVQNQADATAVSANGKSTNYNGSIEPSHPQAGDLWYWKNGDLSGIKQFVDGEWVDLVDSATEQKISDSVDKAVTDAKTYSDQVIATNRAQIDAEIKTVSDKTAQLETEQAELDTKAQGYANKALADAKANTLATATQTAKDAQEYTDTAKAEAISVATKADGIINQKIDDTASSITRTISQNKSDADGKISTAQSTATQALDGLTQKVSQNIYDAKVNELTGKISTAQQTADGAVTTIGNYKQSNDGRVASAESAIQQNANAITQKVSQTDYNAKTGELSGKISEFNQTAEKISQSVSDVKAQVDGLSVGGRNLFLNSKKLSWSVASNGADGHIVAFDDTTNMLHITAPSGYGTGTGVYFFQDTEKVSSRVQNGQQWAMSFDIKGTGNFANGAYIGSEGSNNYNGPTGAIPADWKRVHFTGTATQTGGAIILYFGASNVPLDVYIKLPKLEIGNIATDWSPAPEDTDNKISTVSQTVDSISSIVSDPTTGLTKRVQTAEGTLSQVTGADIPALQKATYWQPYGSLDFNSYTKQGSFFFNTTSAKTNGPTSSTSWTYLMVEQGTADNGRIKQTAWYDGVTGVKITYVRTLNSGTWSPWYANDNDSVATIAQTNGAIKTEISDRQKGDTNTLTQAKDFTTSSISNSESGMRSQITQTSDAIIAKIEATNLVTNSEFDPDNVGWYKLPVDGSTIDVSGKVTTPIKSYYADWDAVNGSRGMEFGATTGTWITSEPVRASSTGTYSISVLAGRPIAPATAVTMDFRLGLWDKDKKYITSVGSTNPLNGTTYLPLKYYKSENITVPSNTAFVSFVLGHSGSGTPDAIYHPMINHGATISPYTPTYGTTASSTVLSLLKDNWSIGIADNAGAITSGIVGNSSNMSLISNNVIINSPSTQIKGTAWINSAMIGNGQIGNAQIGNASITSAKIASLDVAKITGNVSSFIQSNWNGVFASTTIDNAGMSINSGNAITKFDGTGAHVMQGGKTADYAFGTWLDDSGHNTTSNGLYIGSRGDENSFTNIVGAGGGSMMLFASANMDSGSNQNIHNGAINMFASANIRARLEFKANKVVQSTYIEADEIRRTLNFYTDNAWNGDGNYFWFNQNVLSAGTFNSTSVLSKKNVDSPYTEDALGEISKTQLVNFAYKNRPDQNHVSPIIDDVNDNKEYYIPKTILGQDGEYVDMYSMISMTWKALQQVNDRLKKLESR